jgi:acetolactate synthase-1/2/3 large subunit
MAEGETMSNELSARSGGDVLIETLKVLGATTVFGIPGQHALAAFDALRRSGLHYVGCRNELNAGFAADGYARATGNPAVLLVSAGPGALATLPALQEAAASCTPVVAIGSQIPRAGLGGREKGYLHELRDQKGSFREIVKSVESANQASQIPSALAAAWQAALTPPYGPVWIEIPQDVLLEPARIPPVSDMPVNINLPIPRRELLAEAVRQLELARRPVIVAGGGVLRARAQHELLNLAENLRAPVVTTFGGKGVFPWTHPLSLQSWLEDRFTTEFLEGADLLLVVGTGLGELSSNYRTLAPAGKLIHVEADLGKLEANYPGLGIHGDALLTLQALANAVAPRAPDGVAEEMVSNLLARVRERIGSQHLNLELGILDAVRNALPDDAQSFWDMTILGYWAWSAWDPRTSGSMQSAQGAGGLGFAYPAAIGAAVASHAKKRVLAISGDGGAMYGIAELATVRQHSLPVTWLIVDDGGYGILREYMTGTFGEAYGTELSRPDFVALATAFGIPARSTTPQSLLGDLSSALGADGPNVVVLPATLRMFAPTHLGSQ